jgi:hypothetical protein
MVGGSVPRPANFIPLKDAHFIAIGRVAVEWASLEDFIAYGVRTLLAPSDYVGRTVTAHTQFLTNCDILRALLHTRFPNKPSEVKALSKFIEDLSKDKPKADKPEQRKSPRSRRNEIIHGSWNEAADPPEIFTVTYKARGKLKHTVTPQPAAKVAAFADELAVLNDRLWDQLQPLLALWLELMHRKPGASRHK